MNDWKAIYKSITGVDPVEHKISKDDAIKEIKKTTSQLRSGFSPENKNNYSLLELVDLYGIDVGGLKLNSNCVKEIFNYFWDEHPIKPRILFYVDKKDIKYAFEYIDRANFNISIDKRSVNDLIIEIDIKCDKETLLINSSEEDWFLFCGYSEKKSVKKQSSKFKYHYKPPTFYPFIGKKDGDNLSIKDWSYDFDDRESGDWESHYNRRE
jgi:hypothetical protein